MWPSQVLKLKTVWFKTSTRPTELNTERLRSVLKVKGSGRGQGWGDAPGHLDPAQVVDQRLHVREDALGVRLVPHDHHVLHFQQRHAVGVRPGTETEEEGVRKRRVDHKPMNASLIRPRAVIWFIKSLCLVDSTKMFDLFIALPQCEFSS